MDISNLARLVAGIWRNVDLSQNTLVVGSLKVGTASPTELTKIILDRLVSLQNGSDVDASYHTHNTIYYTKTEVGAASGTTGSDLVGDDNTYSNFTPTAATVKGALSGIDAALSSAANPVFNDSTFRIQDDLDSTKQIAFDASEVATSTIRTIKMANANVDLAKVLSAIQDDGSVAFTANQSMGNFKLTNLANPTDLSDAANKGYVDDQDALKVSKAGDTMSGSLNMGNHLITNVATPVAGTDAANKNYVDNAVTGLSWKAPALVLNASSTTKPTALPVIIDGVTLATGNRVLFTALSGGESADNNKVWVVNVSGPTATWSLASDFTSGPLDGWAVYIKEGAINGDSQWNYNGTTWVQFSGAGQIQAGIGLTKTGNTLDINLGAGITDNLFDEIAINVYASGGLDLVNPATGLPSSANDAQLAVKLNGNLSGLELALNGLSVKLNSAGALSKSGAGIDVNVDDSTVGINANALYVKNDGITATQLAANSVTAVKIAVDAVDGTKIRLANDQWLRARNSTDSADVNILKVDTTEKVEFASIPEVATAQTNRSTAAANDFAKVEYVNSLIDLPKVPVTVGESFAANTTFAVRVSMAELSDTTGRVYKADYDASTADKFHVIGYVQSATSLTAGASTMMYLAGELTLGASDTAFGAADVGKPVFLTAAGAWTVVPPSASGQASVIIGYVSATNKIWLVPARIMGIN